MAQAAPSRGSIGKRKAFRSAHHKAVGRYVRQAVRTRANKERAWKRHLLRHPQDAAVIQAARLRMVGVAP